MRKIKFLYGSSSPFFKALDKEVKKMLATTNLLKRSKRLLWLKMILYSVAFLTSYLLLITTAHATFACLLLNYVLIGIMGILLAFNVSHDACHGSFSKNKKINTWLYHLTFNMQGTNAYLWKIRHSSSHHLFPNVDGCDADIDNNPFIRLSPQHPLRKHHRYQHIYSVIIYCIYTLHWFLFKDLLYLFKKGVANLQNKKHSVLQKILFFSWKLIYMTAFILIPVLCGHAFSDVLICFLVMHVCSSLLFIHTLIETHLCMETHFPQTDELGNLPGDYYTHQLATSLDYSPTSKFFNFLFGGFNAHAAHHLYPKLPHTAYPEISALIEKKAKEFNIRYNKLSMSEAIQSHYRYLKMMGRFPDKGFSEGSAAEYMTQIKMSIVSSL